MAKEIELKYLVDPHHPQLRALLAGPGTLIKQGYICTQETGVVRVRIRADRAFLTIKGPRIGIVCDEFEYPIPLADAEAMLASMCGNIIEKRRYLFAINDGLVVEVDVFAQIDLILAEVELPRENTPFDKPAWFTKDVSDDPRYYNSNIANLL